MTYTSLLSLTAAFIYEQQPVISDEFGFLLLLDWYV